MDEDKKAKAEEAQADDASEEQADTQPTSEADVSEGAGKEETPTEDDIDTLRKKYKSVTGKMSALEKERNKYKTAATIFDALNEAAKSDPKFMLEANEKLLEKGVITESEFNAIKQQVGEPETGRPVSEPEAPSGMETHPAVQWAQRKYEEEQQKDIQFFTKFEEDKEDIGEGDPNTVQARRKAITAAAIINENRGMDRESAYNQAYFQIMHPEKLKEEGELEGIAKSQSGVPANIQSAGQSSKGKASPRLTDQEREIAQSFGMTDEEYAAYRDNPNQGID